MEHLIKDLKKHLVEEKYKLQDKIAKKHSEILEVKHYIDQSKAKNLSWEAWKLKSKQEAYQEILNWIEYEENE